jgi:hypothetical protein
MQYDVWRYDDMMQNDEYVEDAHPRAHTGIHKTLHPLRNVFESLSSASPKEQLLSFFTFYFGGI